MVTVEDVVMLVLVEANEDEDEVGGVLCAASAATFQMRMRRRRSHAARATPFAHAYLLNESRTSEPSMIAAK